MAELSYHYPSITIMEPRFAYDDNWVAGKLLEEQLEITPDTEGNLYAGTGRKWGM